MIICDKQGVKCKGNGIDLLCEFTNIARLLYENNIAGEETLHHCIDIVTKSEEELEKEDAELKARFLEEIEDLIDTFKRVKKMAENDELDDEDVDDINEIFKHLTEGEDDDE